jgi:GntR family transcriptional regulator/MocR family aminotransferase
MEPIFNVPISLSPRPVEGLLRCVHLQLRNAILDGRLQPGLKLPASRQLASVLGVSRNTVLAAYDLLAAEGYLVGRAGDGTYVADIPRAQPPPNVPKHNDGSDQRLAPFWRGFRLPRMAGVTASYQYDFRTGCPDIKRFPFEIWRRLSARQARALSQDLTIDSDPQGRVALREAVAKYVSFARAVACGRDDIVIVNGTRDALDLIARVLVTPGETRVVVEDPVFPPLRNVFAAAGARILPVAVDAEGLNTENLPEEARVICVSPSHQFPLGVAMSARRRAALLDFARSFNAVVVEDDYDSEFRVQGRPLDALQTLDRGEHVFYVGTFSKSLFPTLRIGFIAVPPWARTALVAAKSISDGYTAVHAQETLAAFISEGHLARHVRKMQRLYANRHATLLQALLQHCADVLRPLPAAAGVHLAARFIAPADGRRVSESALKEGICVDALERYGWLEGAPSGLAFGYGLIEEEDIEPGIKSLTPIIRQALH